MINNDNIHELRFEEKKITLIGTAHISLESVNLVEQVIEEQSPDTVCVELCQSRYESIIKKNQWQNTNLIKVIKQKKAFLLLSNLMLAYFQKKIGKKIGIKPGEEIIRAVQKAKEVNASICLADRDISITLSRIWRFMGLWTKIKLLAQFITSIFSMEEISEEDIEKMKEKDILETLLSEIGKAFPIIRRTLIDERDEYLAYKIRTAPGNNIVAVVGAGHAPGIQRHWKENINIDALNYTPPKSKFFNMLKWGIPTIIIAIIILGFFMAGSSAGTHMIKWWILANAIFSGIGAAIALAHPITILSAVVAAPLTSLNPMIAAGWVSGLIETILGRPKVRDFEKLPEDISSIKGFWKNKITRILLVVVFTNIGSSIGTFVAIPLMVKVFA